MTHRSHPRTGRLRAAALVLAAALAGATHAAPADDVRRLVESGQYGAAYEEARRHPQLAGDVHFDLLLGIAAVNAGRVPEGILALERHLAAVPANDRARLELARGYFLIGEYARARSEFAFVLRYNPPQAVREQIAGFLQAMELRADAGTRSTARAYVEAGAGHDTNVNGGTFRDELQFAFGTVNLAGSPSQGAADDFVQLAAGAQQTLRVSPRMSVFAGLDLDHKRNVQLRDFDLTNLGATVGFTVVGTPALVRGTLGLGTLQVGGNRYRDTLTVGAEASFTHGASLSTMVFGQLAEFRFAGAENVRNARGITLGGMVTKSFADVPGAPQLGVRASLLQEDNLSLRRDLARIVPLVRVFASASPAEGWRLSGGLTVYGQRFRNPDIVFGTTRSDTSASVDLAASYALAPQWTLRGEYLWLQNRSNQDLYDSRRQSFAIKTRYQY